MANENKATILSKRETLEKVIRQHPEMVHYIILSENNFLYQGTIVASYSDGKEEGKLIISFEPNFEQITGHSEKEALDGIIKALQWEREYGQRPAGVEIGGDAGLAPGAGYGGRGHKGGYPSNTTATSGRRG